MPFAKPKVGDLFLATAEGVPGIITLELVRFADGDFSRPQFQVVSPLPPAVLPDKLVVRFIRKMTAGEA